MPTLDEIAELGRELARLGWKPYVDSCRELYAAQRDGKPSDWSLEHAAKLRRWLGLGPDALPAGLECPRCPKPLPGHWNGKRTVAHLPDRWVSACSGCGAEWVTRVR